MKRLISPRQRDDLLVLNIGKCDDGTVFDKIRDWYGFLRSDYALYSNLSINSKEALSKDNRVTAGAASIYGLSNSLAGRANVKVIRYPAQFAIAVNQTTNLNSFLQVLLQDIVIIYRIQIAVSNCFCSVAG